MLDVDCQCGNPGCYSNLHYRFGLKYFEDGHAERGFYIDATDGKGSCVELMLNRRDAVDLLLFLLYEVSGVRKLVSKMRRYA